MNDDRVHSVESGMVKRASRSLDHHHGRRQPPTVHVSSSKTRAKQMLDGDVQNDQLLAFIYDLDPGDDWTDQRRNWGEVNPRSA